MLCLAFQILKEKKGQANKTKKETTKNTQLDWNKRSGRRNSETEDNQTK